MTSTPKDRLFEIYETYRIANSKSATDWKEAKTMAEANKIQKNLDTLETLYLKAATSELDRNGSEVEEAFGLAKAAREAVDNAYKEAKNLPERINTVSDAAKSVANLVRKATGR